VIDLVDLYLCGWVVTTTVAMLAAHRFGDDRAAPELQSLAGASVIAGALWPVLVLGIVELGSLATLSKLRR
jgi:hypothetical protein